MRFFIYLLLLLSGDCYIKPILHYNKNIVSDLTIPNVSSKKTENNYKLNLNKTITSLKINTERFPYYDLDWSIYTKNVQFSDPYGIETIGLKKYKNIFSVIRFLRILTLSQVFIKYKLYHNLEQHKIIIKMSSEWITKHNDDSFHFDIVSNYYLDKNGIIYKHELTPFQINYNNKYSTKDLFYNLYNDKLVIPQSVAIYDTHSLNMFNTCEYIWDCESPMNCCDFIFTKVCCADGYKDPTYIPELVPIPIPIPIDLVLKRE